MRYLVVGLGNLGQKRRHVLREKCVATVDPINPAADYLDVSDCPPDHYDAVVLAVPTQQKLPLLEYFLKQGNQTLFAAAQRLAKELAREVAGPRAKSSA